MIMYTIRTKKSNRNFGEMTVCKCETIEQANRAYQVTKCLGVREIINNK